MYCRVLAGVLLTGLIPDYADAYEAPAIPFIDGRWSGDIETGPNNSDFEGCSASTTFSDGTMLKLTRRKSGDWYLQLSNPAWKLPYPGRYAITALVDFYPRLHLLAEAKTNTLFEIADLEDFPLVGFIEIGHTIDLASNEFNGKYELEGSAKVIERIRDCYVDHSR